MCELIQVKMISFISCFAVIVQTVNGLNSILHGHGCNYLNPSGTSLYMLSLEQCKKECCVRASCRAVDYFRKEQKCALLQADDYTDMYTGKESICVHIAKEHIICLNACPCTAPEICNDVSITCTVKECAYIGKIQNAVVLGNMNQIGSRLKIRCAYGYRDSSYGATSECLPSGSWSYQHQCNRITIGDACTSDSDCLESGSVCIHHTCFCGPLYRYNTATMDCVKVCSRMTDEFTKHSDIYISHFNLADDYANDCSTRCIKSPACLSYEVLYSCFYGVISYDMAMDVDPGILVQNPGETLYSRNCE